MAASNNLVRVIDAAFRLAREADDACDDGVTSCRLRGALAAFWEAYKDLEHEYRAKPDYGPPWPGLR